MTFVSNGDLAWMQRRAEKLRRRANRADETPEKEARRLALQRERSRRYREKNPERVRSTQAYYREVNNEEINARQRARRAVKRAAKVDAEAEQERQRIERQKELRRAQQRRYYARHREKCAAMTQAWLERNPGYMRQADRDRYALDPEKKKARTRAYYAANKEAILAARRERRNTGGMASL